MKDEYDFSKGVRGQFFRPDARLNIPVYLDQIAVREVEATKAPPNIWQAIKCFRQQMDPTDHLENEDVFANVRDRSAGREVVL